MGDSLVDSITKDKPRANYGQTTAERMHAGLQSGRVAWSRASQAQAWWEWAPHYRANSTPPMRCIKHSGGSHVHVVAMWVSRLCVACSIVDGSALRAMHAIVSFAPSSAPPALRS